MKGSLWSSGTERPAGVAMLTRAVGTLQRGGRVLRMKQDRPSAPPKTHFLPQHAICPSGEEEDSGENAPQTQTLGRSPDTKSQASSFL